ncbi:MAG: hypothetical protein HYX68_08465 [Planctomycetes bacterium]|nr:hypothetical protein [Planctomycetota bacterium]
MEEFALEWLMTSATSRIDSYKVYSGFSPRRFMTALFFAKEDGFIRSEICYNSVINFLEKPALTPILKAMIVEASRLLASVEVDFAGGSTGFMTTRYERWFDDKYGTPRKKQEWVKLPPTPAPHEKSSKTLLQANTWQGLATRGGLLTSQPPWPTAQAGSTRARCGRSCR